MIKFLTMIALFISLTNLTFAKLTVQEALEQTKKEQGKTIVDTLNMTRLESAGNSYELTNIYNSLSGLNNEIKRQYKNEIERLYEYNSDLTKNELKEDENNITSQYNIAIDNYNKNITNITKRYNDYIKQVSFITFDDIKWSIKDAGLGNGGTITVSVNVDDIETLRKISYNNGEYSGYYVNIFGMGRDSVRDMVLKNNKIVKILKKGKLKPFPLK